MRRHLGAAAVAMAAMAVGIAGSAGASTPYTIGGDNNFEEYHSGVLPAGGTPLCYPGDPACDHIEMTVRNIEGQLDIWTDEFGYLHTGFPNRCVGVSTVEPQPQISTPTKTHIAVYAKTPGLTEPIAVSYDGTLVFWGSPGVTYDVMIGHADGLANPATPYDARLASQDIELGYFEPFPDDLRVCAPLLWGADTALEHVRRQLP